MDRMRVLWQQTQDKMKFTAEATAEKLKQEADALKHKAAGAAERAKETVEETAKSTAEKLQETVHDTKARAKVKAHEVGASIAENVKNNKQFFADAAKDKAETLRHRAGETLADASHEMQSLRRQSGEKAAELKSQATQTLRSQVADGAQKLRDSSSAVVDRLDPRVHARRTRNRLLVLGFSAIALYGFASSAPDAISRYAIERVKIQEEAKMKQRKREAGDTA